MAELMLGAGSFLGVLIGAAMLFIPLITMKKKKKRCTQPVRVTCTELRELAGNTYTEPVSGALISEAMKPRFEGQLNGQPLVIESNVYSSPHPQIGEVKELMINPDNHNDYLEPNKSHFFEYAIIAIGAIVFVAAGYQLVCMTIAFGEMDRAIESGNVVEVEND